MPDYIIDHTDPANGSFVIKPYTTNGPLTPIAPTPLDPQAVAADTSIVLLGQGMWMYGERIQESIVHMLEHFAYDTAPVYPVQGQIWFKNTAPQGLFVYDGAVWQPAVGGFPLVGDLDMGGFNIVNLGTPADPSDDAVSVNFANATYLRLDATNDPVTGDLTVAANIILTGGLSQVTLPNAPVAATDATNKAYVDAIELADLDDVNIIGPVIGEFLQYDGAFWTNVATAIPTTLDSLSDVVIVAPAVGDVLYYDGVNWINNPASASDRSVQSGAMTTTGTSPGTTLRLTMNVAPLTVDITGIAPHGHEHSTGAIFHDENPTFDSSYIRAARVSITASQNPSFPQEESFNNVVDALDQAIYATRGPTKRRILQGDGATTTFPTPEYLTYSNKLSIYSNGVKQYASNRGTATLLLDTPTATHASNTGLSVADYAITAVSTGADTFEVAGDQTAFFTAGTEFSVLGSTGNDGLWQVSGSVFAAGFTTITIDTTPSNPFAQTDVINATVDGIISVVDVDDYEFDIAVDTADFPPGTTTTTVTVRPAPLEVNLAIANVDTLLETFTVVGDYTTVFVSGRIFVVTDSTGNNGNWTVTSSVLTAGNTVITVTGDVTSAVIDGTISVAYVSIAGLTEEITFELATATIPATAFFRDSAILFIPDSQGNTSTVELDETSGGGTDLFNTLNTFFTASEILYDSYGSEVDITAVDTANDEFDIAGDYTAAFPTGTLFTVQQTSGWTIGFPLDHGDNDGVFEVQAPGATFAAGTTTIPVTADLTVNTGATGTIYFARALGYDESGVPLDADNPGSTVTFAAAPADGAVIEVLVTP